KYQLVGPRKLRANGSGQAKAHGTESSGVDPQARLMEADKLSGPHLVLADVRGDDGAPLREAIDFGHEVLRLDFGIALDRLERMLLFPGADLAPPGASRGGALLVGRGGIVAEQLVDLGENAFHVADDRNVRGADLADFGGIDIHVDDFGVRSESGQAASDAIVEANA